MKRSRVIIVVLAALSVAAGAFVLNNNSKQEADTVAQNTNGSMADTTMNSIPEQNVMRADDSAANDSRAEPKMAAEVVISNYAFAPQRITIRKGGKITWVNREAVRHAVTPDKSADDFKASDLLADGESYSVTFNKAGTYTYICSLHPYMKGTVEVIE